MGEVRIGIVGSRRRNTLYDRRIIFIIVARAIAGFPGQKVVIVSGGAKGPDAYAREAAEFYGLGYREHPVPKDPPIVDRWDFQRRAFARNREIVVGSDVIFALAHPDRKGGTENTIGHAIELQKQFFLVDQTGRCYLSGEGWNTENVPTSDKA